MSRKKCAHTNTLGKRFCVQPCQWTAESFRLLLLFFWALITKHKSNRVFYWCELQRFTNGVESTSLRDSQTRDVGGAVRCSFIDLGETRIIPFSLSSALLGFFLLKIRSVWFSSPDSPSQLCRRNLIGRTGLTCERSAANNAPRPRVSIVSSPRKSRVKVVRISTLVFVLIAWNFVFFLKDFLRRLRLLTLFGVSSAAVLPVFFFSF